MKILVVEDNQKVARFLARALEEEGHVVDQVSDGERAIEQIEAVPYDLVLLDWMLPGMDGLAVCRRARALGCRVPILMLTARGEVAQRVLGLDAGADDYMSKPFDVTELLARVRALTRRNLGTELVLRLGPITLDLVERRALLHGKRLDLTPREFNLLAHLIREAGRPVSRSVLLAKVWQTNFDPSSNLVEVHVRKLREKLGVDSTLIETVRGVGYRAVVPE